MICDITKPFPGVGRLRSRGSCSPQRCQRPHRYPRHRRGWPARYPAANSPWPPPPQTGHGQPETPPHHHRRKTPATTSLPAPPDRSSTASTPPSRQTPTATPPTAEYEHLEDSSQKSFRQLITVATHSHSVVVPLPLRWLRTPSGRHHRHSWPIAKSGTAQRG